jgi:hypothetical protein
LRVIDQAQQRPFGRHFRQQAQHGQADQETVRHAARPQAERDAKRVPLRAWQPVKMAQHPPHSWCSIANGSSMSASTPSARAGSKSCATSAA